MKISAGLNHSLALVSQDEQMFFYFILDNYMDLEIVIKEIMDKIKKTIYYLSKFKIFNKLIVKYMLEEIYQF